MKTILLLDNLEFDVHNGPVGVAVSGGADSAILLYLVMKYCPGPINVYTCANEVKKRRNAYHALDVLSVCMDLSGKTAEHTTFFVNEQTFYTLFYNLSNKIIKDRLTKMYTSVTSLPPVSVTDTFVNPAPLKDKRDPTIKKQVYNGTNKEYYSPFVNVDKSVIKKLYEQEGLINTLFPLTRSCESITEFVGHCGKCWWCEERLWAFNQGYSPSS